MERDLTAGGGSAKIAVLVAMLSFSLHWGEFFDGDRC
jgi:hypothetical protein